MFSSHIWTNLLKTSPPTSETGEIACWVAWAANIAVRAGSTVDCGCIDGTTGGVGTLAKVEPRKMAHSRSFERFIVF